MGTYNRIIVMALFLTLFVVGIVVAGITGKEKVDIKELPETESHIRPWEKSPCRLLKASRMIYPVLLKKYLFQENS